jgi:hypothetical protein
VRGTSYQKSLVDSTYLEVMAIRFRHERVADKKIGVLVAQQVLAWDD